MQFRHLIAQQAVQQQVLSAISQQRQPHAWLFIGPPGVGKLPLAWAIAQYMNCVDPNPSDSCGQCANCRKTAGLTHPDVHWIFPIPARTEGGGVQRCTDFMDLFRQAVTTEPYLSLSRWSSTYLQTDRQLFIPIAEIRELRQRLMLKPLEGQYRIVILWQIDRMNAESANAFLKLLEEPPLQTLLLLTIDSIKPVLPTIVSRCQTIRCPRLPSAEIAHALTTRKGIVSTHAAEIAVLADGDYAHALKLSEQQPAETALTEPYLHWMRLCWSGKLEPIYNWMQDQIRQPVEAQRLFLEFALQKMQDMIYLHAGLPELTLLLPNARPGLEKLAAVLSSECISLIVSKLESAKLYLARNANPQFVWITLSIELHTIFQPTSLFSTVTDLALDHLRF
jgi:DNA polymerase-3 subunit delta'